VLILPCHFTVLGKNVYLGSLINQPDMKKHRLLLLFILPLLCACHKNFYAPALYNNDISYQPKPSSFDSAKTASYVSLGFGTHEGVSSSTTITFGELNLSRGHVFNNVNLAYGAFGFAGAIDNSNHDNEKSDPNSFASKSFGGVGGRLSANLFQKTGNVNFRYLGFEAAYSKEFGDFAAFRRDVYNLPNYHSTLKTELLTVGGTSEILWRGNATPDNQFAFRLFIGANIGDYSYLKSSSDDGIYKLNQTYVAGSFFFKIKHIYGVAEGTRNLNPLTGFRLKMGYQF
jgi:hypothetical protein